MILNSRNNILSYLNPYGYRENYSTGTIFTSDYGFVKTTIQQNIYTVICPMYRGDYLGVS